MPKQSESGYTVVEMLIVLAVTAVIAVGAFAGISDQRQKNEFALGVRDFEQKITDIANDVSQGYFPNRGNNITCTAAVSGISFSIASREQGNNADCVFAAKVIQFQPEGNDRQMRVLTVAARRLTRDGKPVTSLNDLSLNDIGSVDDGSMNPMLDEMITLSYGMRVKSVSSGNAVAFMTGFANKAAVGAGLTGTTKTKLYSVSGSSLSQPTAALLASLKQPSNYAEPGASGIVICLEHGQGSQRTAKITLGLNGQAQTHKEMGMGIC